MCEQLTMLERVPTPPARFMRLLADYVLPAKESPIAAMIPLMQLSALVYRTANQSGVSSSGVTLKHTVEHGQAAESQRQASISVQPPSQTVGIAHIA
jgi:hypothetical protein